MAAKRAPATPTKPTKPAAAATPRLKTTKAATTPVSISKPTAKEATSKAPARRAKEATPPPPPPASTPTITTKQLAAQFGEAHSLPRREAETVMVDVIGLLVEHLKAGDKLRLNGLGILQVKHLPARAGRNPATGEAIQIAASKKVTFRPAKELKDAI
jgi:DNA-binding protein HU-beta